MKVKFSKPLMVGTAAAAFFLIGGLSHADTTGPEAPASAAMLIGNAGHGRTLYQACQACHSIDENDIGPSHRGVVGRRAGSVSNYDYSPALKNSGITWNEALLDRWLTNPSALVPGTKMFFQLGDAQSRADIIAFLKEQQ